jgi:thiosulfate/3-mercaptopyruvate sulfurtransferase
MTAATRSPLLDADTLMARIDDPNLRLFDCRFSLAQPELGRCNYASGHLPRAVYAHLDDHLSGSITPTSGRHPLPVPTRLADWLGRCGVDNATDVVVYDDMGGAFAVRLWWLLRWLGHEQAAVLDGGLQAWVAAGGTLSADEPATEARLFVPKPDDGLWLNTGELKAELQGDTIQVIDARAPERFRGEVEPIDPVAGHIPGAINLPLSENLDDFGRFLGAAALRKRFADAIGARSPERIAHSCGSGVNACHNLLAMELAGLPGSRLYAGSWSEWIRDPARPVAVGA